MAKTSSRSNRRSFSISKVVYLELKPACDALGLPVSVVVERLINSFIDDENVVKDELIGKLDELVSLHKGTLSEE